MTDYYVTGSAFSAYGPYTYEDAVEAGKALANDLDGETTVHVVATVETPYSKHYDDELPEDPDDVTWRPWNK